MNIYERLAFAITTFITEFSIAIGFTLAYGESLRHAGQLFMAVWMNLLAIPVYFMTDFFTGFTNVEWFFIVFVWLSHLGLARVVDKDR